MARGKKKTQTVRSEALVSPETVSRTIQIKLAEIARRLGTTVPALIESYGDAQVVIEKFDSGNLQLLNEEEAE